MKKINIYIALNGHTKRAIDNFRQYLLTNYQGFTEYNTIGYYQSVNETDGKRKTYVEDSINFEILTTKSVDNLKSHIKQMFGGLGEESILYTMQHVDELEFIGLE